MHKHTYLGRWQESNMIQVASVPNRRLVPEQFAPRLLLYGSWLQILISL